MNDTNIKDTKLSKVVIGSNRYYESEVPIKCPYCDTVIEPHPIHCAGLNYTDTSNVYITTFRGNCCSKVFFTTHEIDKTSKKGTFLYVYPFTKSRRFTNAVQIISPRFIQLYNQAFFAEKHNFFELAGSGYRSATEVLIKDYAINILKEPYNKVVKKTLYEAIGAYLPSIKLSTSADVVRVIGNDYTHYERKYKDVDFDILKQYLEIFIQAIITEYLINNPVIPTNR